MKKEIRAAGAKLGGVLLTYAILCDLLAYGFYYVAYFVLEGTLSLSFNTVREGLLANHEALVRSTSFAMVLNISVTGTSLIVVFLLAKLVFKLDFEGYFRPTKEGAKTGLIWAPACLIINMVLSILVFFLTSSLSRAGVAIPDSDLSVRNPTPLAIVLQLLYVIILAPIFEETLYRGVVLGAMARYGKTAAILLSALSFGLMHGNIPQAASAFATGLVYATIAVNSGSIVPTIVIHCLNNLIANYSDIADALDLPHTTVIVSVVSIVTALIGAYVVFTRYRFLRIGRSQRLETGETPTKALFTEPVIVAYLCYLGIELIYRIVLANA